MPVSRGEWGGRPGHGPLRARAIAAALVLSVLAGLAHLVVAPVYAAEAGFLGLEVQGFDERVADALGASHPRGVLVKDVAVGEPGAIAGVRRGDLIVEFAGAKITAFEDLLKQVAKTNAGARIKVGVLRAGKNFDLEIQTTARPAAWRIDAAKYNAYPDVGFTAVAITEDVRKKFELPWGSVGVVVSAVESGGRTASALKAGEVIVSANLQDIWDPAQLTRQMEDARKNGRGGVLVLIRSAAGYRYSVLPVK